MGRGAGKSGREGVKLTSDTECLEFELCAVVDDKAAELVQFPQLLRLPFKVLGPNPVPNLLDFANINCQREKDTYTR